MSSSRLILLSLSTVITLLPVPAAWSQVAPAPVDKTGTEGAPSAQVDTDTGLQDIVVTANRQAQNLQKVSAAVQVIDGVKLKDQALTNIGQIFQNTPSINATSQPGGYSINIRGQGGDLPSGSAQGSVALEFDGVYNVLSQATTVGFFDVNRIEVLPGPQSTRYGPNADGGVVNVITNDPVLGSYAGNAALTVGNYGLVRGEISQNVPISDTLALRVAGAAIHRNSFLEPGGANAIGQSIRAKLLYQPSDALKIKLQYQWDHIGGTGAGVEPYGISKVAPYSGDSINDLYGNPWNHGDFSTNSVVADDNTASIHQQTVLGSLSYGFSSWAALDVLASYVKTSGKQTSCYAGGPPWLIGGDKTCYEYDEFAPFNQYSAEVRLHNAAGSTVVWNVGYYYFDYSRTTRNAAGSVLGSTSGTTTNALFADVTYPVVDRLRLIAGARQSWDERRLRPNGLEQTFTLHPNHTDYRVGEEFDLSPTSMQYFTLTTGYRPGGLGGYNAVTNSSYSFNNEVNKAYEFGVKNRLFGNTLQLNADVFYYDQSGYQFQDAYHGYVAPGETNACGPGDQRPACAAQTFGLAAYSLGAEAQIRYSPTRSDVFGLSATYLKARFRNKQGTCATLGALASSGACLIGYNDQGTDALLFVDIAGAVQPHSPKFAGTITYNHTFRFTSGAHLTLGGDVFHSAAYLVHPVQDTSGYSYQPGYEQYNLNASYSPASEKWSLSAYARNLSNYAVKQSTLPYTIIGDPLTVGATVNVHW